MGNLTFNPKDYISGTVIYKGRYIDYRQYTVTYVARPNAPKLQKMNIFVREDMADDHEAAILFIHRDGGMSETKPWDLEMEKEEGRQVYMVRDHVMSGSIVKNASKESKIAAILDAGFVLASPGARGRETFIDRQYIGRGKVPKTIVDLKAAVRYLKFNKGLVPGNPDKIVSEGGSSGGGSSALLGASGNCHFYDEHLEWIGAARATDDIYMAIVDSPIHDFAHIDEAYEWQFGPEFVSGLFADDADKMAMSRAIRERYVEYVDSLELKNPETGERLSIRDGSYTRLLRKKWNESLNVFLGSMSDDDKTAWLSAPENAGLAVMKDGKAELTSFSAYINWNAGRWMKYVGCYDGFDDFPSRENEAFGPMSGGTGHFAVEIAEAIGTVPGYESEADSWRKNAIVNAGQVKKLDTYQFLRGREMSDVAPYWYVRCGGNHETTGAIFMNLCLLLEERKDITVDWRFCWQQNHTSISLKEFDETLEFLNKYC